MLVGENSTKHSYRYFINSQVWNYLANQLMRKTAGTGQPRENASQFAQALSSERSGWFL